MQVRQCKNTNGYRTQISGVCDRYKRLISEKSSKECSAALSEKIANPDDEPTSSVRENSNKKYWQLELEDVDGIEKDLFKEGGSREFGNIQKRAKFSQKTASSRPSMLPFFDDFC